MLKSDNGIDYRRIEISELPKQIPDFKESNISKDGLIREWLSSWINLAISQNKIKPNDLLPTKPQLASYLGVSIGTVQNAIRYVEDSGLLVSKQRIGTMIVGSDSNFNSMRKLTSKRDKIVLQVKKMIIDSKIKINQSVPSSRKLATIFGASPNTTRLAYEYLCSIGILESRATRGNDANWILKRIPVLSEEQRILDLNIDSNTLVNKVSEDLKLYINQNLKVSDRLPAHLDLAKLLNVSIKTVHDAMKKLVSEGILLSRRGRYGTVVVKLPNAKGFQPLKENSIFAKAEDAAFYSYQKVEDSISAMIKNECELGDKLPSMEILSKKFDVSTNTIRKALQNLSKQGFVQFGRGRYGGTFITDIPENTETQTFKWLAVNPHYVETFAN